VYKDGLNRSDRKSAWKTATRVRRCAPRFSLAAPGTSAASCKSIAAKRARVMTPAHRYRAESIVEPARAARQQPERGFRRSLYHGKRSSALFKQPLPPMPMPQSTSSASLSPPRISHAVPLSMASEVDDRAQRTSSASPVPSQGSSILMSMKAMQHRSAVSPLPVAVDSLPGGNNVALRADLRASPQLRNSRSDTSVSRRPASLHRPPRWPQHFDGVWLTDGGRMLAQQDAQAVSSVNALSFVSPSIAHLPEGQRIVYASERVRAEARQTLRGAWHNSATFGSTSRAYRDGWLHTRARDNDPFTGARLGFVP
jgi:hypothetical protein